VPGAEGGCIEQLRIAAATIAIMVRDNSEKMASVLVLVKALFTIVTFGVLLTVVAFVV
jgi:hypothetical protein